VNPSVTHWRSARNEGPATALVAALLCALRDESDALKSSNPARLAAAESRKRHLLRLLSPANPKDVPGRLLNP
jgi:hypothetical protein